jgi:hypothetical protein
MSLLSGSRRLFFVVALALATAACGSSVAFDARVPEARSESVTVKLVEHDDEIFEFLVLSHSDEQLVILRDDVFLVVDGQRHPREPGGLARTYDLPPGGSHAVNVKFSPRAFRRGPRVRCQLCHVHPAEG